MTGISKKAATGFTLLEILIATVTIAILATIGVFGYVNSYRQSVMKNTGDSVVSLLHLAQQKAVAQEGGSAWGVFIDNSNSGSASTSMYSGNAYATSSVSQNYQISSQISLSSPAAGTTLDVNFQKFSGIPNASGTVILQLNATGETKTITITSQGGISLN